jgi:hypothetical protein
MIFSKDPFPLFGIVVWDVCSLTRRAEARLRSKTGKEMLRLSSSHLNLSGLSGKCMSQLAGGVKWRTYRLA